MKSTKPAMSAEAIGPTEKTKINSINTSAIDVFIL